MTDKTAEQSDDAPAAIPGVVEEVDTRSGGGFQLACSSPHRLLQSPPARAAGPCGAARRRRHPAHAVAEHRAPCL